MILVILVCVLIGYLCGSALAGLAAGLLLFVLTVWAGSPQPYRFHKPRERRRRRYGR